MGKYGEYIDPWGGTGETTVWRGKKLTNRRGGWFDDGGKDWASEMSEAGADSAESDYRTQTLHNAGLRHTGKITREEEMRRNQNAIRDRNTFQNEGQDRVLSDGEYQDRARHNLDVVRSYGMEPKVVNVDKAPQGWTNSGGAQPQQNQQQNQPQSMAQQYGWGAGLGGQQQQPPQSTQQQQWGMQPWGGQQPQQQQAMPQWGQPQQQQMPQWSQPAYQTPPSGGRGVGQMGVSGGPMPQWGGTPQQQAMPQWGQMMQQQPMGGPMAGMEAARMGGGAMQQMGGGSPWASMWGDPFAGRQMTTDPNSPAMGGAPQMDAATQLLMQMQGMMGGGGLSGGFGAGGASGASEGAYQTPPSGGKGVGQQGVADAPAASNNYDSLASILALFAGGGYGGGGGGGYSAPDQMYGGLPRNGLYYADLMRGAGG